MFELIHSLKFVYSDCINFYQNIIISSVYNSSWPEIRLLLSLVLCLLRASCMYILRNVGALDILYAPTIHDGTGITGPQQTNRNSLMIIFYT